MTADSHTVGALGERCAARLVGPASVEIARVGPLAGADATTLTFVRDATFVERWAQSDAGAAIVGRSAFEGDDAPEGAMASLEAASRGRPVLMVDDADLALAAVLPVFAGAREDEPACIDARAVVDPSAEVDPSAHVGPGCVIMGGARVGAGAKLLANVTLGRRASVGAGSVISPGVAIMDDCSVGERCLLHPNASLGADGFNFRPDPGGRGIVKIPHIAGVRVGHDVEIGANSSIDRGKFTDTVVGDGTKIDNLVQVGHNVTIGRCCLICGLVGISGSVTMGDGVIIAGGVGIADQVNIGAGARIGAGSGVINDVPAGETWVGVPAVPARESLPNYAAFRTLARDMRKLKKQAKALEARLATAGTP